MNQKNKLEMFIHEVKPRLFIQRWNEPEIYSLIFSSNGQLRSDIRPFYDEVKKLVAEKNKADLCKKLLSSIDQSKFEPTTDDDYRVFSSVIASKFIEAGSDDEILLTYIGNFMFEFVKQK